jgi:hypothetical protein
MIWCNSKEGFLKKFNRRIANGGKYASDNNSYSLAGGAA